MWQEDESSWPTVEFPSRGGGPGLPPAGLLVVYCGNLPYLSHRWPTFPLLETKCSIDCEWKDGAGIQARICPTPTPVVFNRCSMLWLIWGNGCANGEEICPNVAREGPNSSWFKISNLDSHSERCHPQLAKSNLSATLCILGADSVLCLRDGGALRRWFGFQNCQGYFFSFDCYPGLQTSTSASRHFIKSGPW